METIWLDAVAFEEKGGWYSETQFIRETGQAYLLASGVPGEPVGDARTRFSVRETGVFRVWIRTKNWIPAYSPAPLNVSINGVASSRNNAVADISSWHWECACERALESGEHTLSVSDLTGWFPRFSAVIITNDPDLTPSPENSVFLSLRERLLGIDPSPVNEGDFDVLVAGGGPGGVPAALAAARHGCTVALVHSRPHLGGNASEEAEVSFDGAGASHPGMRETGIADEIKRTRDFYGISWQAAMEKLVAEEKNIKLFTSMTVDGASTENGRITSVTAVGCFDCVNHTFRAKEYIDCTGDGWLGYYAGASYRVGREPKSRYGESYAPEQPDECTMSGCLMGTYGGRQALSYYAEDTWEPVEFHAPEWAVKLGDDIGRNPTSFTSAPWWVENRNDVDDLWEQERARDELIRISIGYFDWLKNRYVYKDRTANLKIVSFPRYNAKRESRRLIGDYVLTQNDIAKETVFGDAVAYTGWVMDVHGVNGIFSGKDGAYHSSMPVPITSVPFRCLYSKNIENLLMAGRNISVSHLALGTTRVESTIATLGQAAGTAASLCCHMALTPRELCREHILTLQQNLMRDDQSIPWLRNADEKNIALTARVSVSSTCGTEKYSLLAGVDGDYEELKSQTEACIFSSDRADGMDIPVEYYKIDIKNTNDGDVTIEASLTKQKWLLAESTVITTAEITVPAHFEGLYTLPIPATQVPFGIRLSACPGLFWRRVKASSYRRTSNVRDEYGHWLFDYDNTFSLVYGEGNYEKADCGKQHLNDGLNRALDAKSYCWVSDPEDREPYAEFSWETPRRISRVRCTFDTDSVNPLYGGINTGVSPKTVRDFDVMIKENGQWRTVGSVRGNFLRLVEVRFDEVTTDAVRVCVRATWGDRSARIFETGIYGEGDLNI